MVFVFYLWSFVFLFCNFKLLQAISTSQIWLDGVVYLWSLRLRVPSPAHRGLNVSQDGGSKKLTKNKYFLFSDMINTNCDLLLIVQIKIKL